MRKPAGSYPIHYIPDLNSGSIQLQTWLQVLRPSYFSKSALELLDDILHVPSPCPYASECPTTKSLPETMITIPMMETLHTRKLGYFGP